MNDSPGSLLEYLLSDDLADQVGTRLPPRAMMALARALPVTQALREALDDGRLSEQTVERFVRRAMANFRPGELFSNEIALVVLAVAMENRGSAFAREFLEELGSLRIAEMPLATQVARICLAGSHHRPKDTYRVDYLGASKRSDGEDIAEKPCLEYSSRVPHILVESACG
jgi:hypothetical protein